ncbi:MAG: ABC transporter ATP-binding protein [Sphingobacteriales bacterium]|nr:ABC transporter ATP-binding protein [Sphingobacteriales bacterium]
MIAGTEYITHVVNEEGKEHNGPLVKASRPSFLREYIFRSKRGLLLVILLGLVSSIASFMLTVIIGDFFMLQFQTGSSKGRLLAWLGVQLQTKDAFFLSFGFLLVIKFVAGFYEKYLSLRHGESFVREIRSQLFTSQMRSSVEQFGKKSFGKYLLRYSNDLKAVQQYLTRGILESIKQSLFIALGIFFLFKLNWILASIICCLFLISAAVIIILSRWQKKTIRQSRDKRSRLLAFVAGNFSRFDFLKREGREDRVIDRFQIRSQHLFDTNLANGWMESFIQSLARFFQFAIIGFSLWLMAGHGLNIDATDGLMVVLLLLLMQGSIRGLLKTPGYLNKGSISIRKINELISLSDRL